MSEIAFLRESASFQRDSGLRGWDPMALELKYAELLHSLIRVMRPLHVIESGAGRGISSVFIAQAILENGCGRFTTTEPDPRFREEAAQRLEGLPAQVLPGDSRDLVLVAAPDLVFLDSGPDTRQAEIDFWLASSSWSGGDTTLVVHDANRDYGLPASGLWLHRGDGLWIG
jgi:predicted O-methyltransferase YrrM